MQPFVSMAETGMEQVILCRNGDVGLHAIIAIHDTTLGPALGGVRLYDYATTEDALLDCLRLARGMTFKAAVAGLDLGGGNAVIIGEPAIKSEGLWRAFGRHVESLGGRFITAEDMNTNVADMNHIRRETRWVLGADKQIGGSGDPAPVTAWGLFHGIRACLEVVHGSSDVAGRTVAIQGVGAVGHALAGYLAEAGASLILGDINERNLARTIAAHGGTPVEPSELLQTACDVLAPCAIGGVINARTIPKLRAPIIAGGANNILEDEGRDSQLLKERGVTYAPDYVINAGGLMSVSAELHGLSPAKAMADAASIFDTVMQVLYKAQSESLSTVDASNRLALERIETVARIKRLKLRGGPGDRSPRAPWWE